MSESPGAPSNSHPIVTLVVWYSAAAGDQGRSFIRRITDILQDYLHRVVPLRQVAQIHCVQLFNLHRSHEHAALSTVPRARSVVTCFFIKCFTNCSSGVPVQMPIFFGPMYSFPTNWMAIMSF